MGGFDPDYFAGIEEMDLGWRIWIQGYKVYYMPTARMYHWESGTFGRRGGYEPIKILFTTRNRLSNMTKNVECFSRGLLLCVVHDSIMLLNYLSQGMLAQTKYLLVSYLQYARRFRQLVIRRRSIQMVRRIDDRWLVRQGILADFRELFIEYFRTRKVSRDAHYAKWESAEAR